MHDNSLPGEELLALAERVAAGVALCSRERRFLWVNATLARWIGRPAHDVAGRSVQEVLGPEAMREIEPYIARVLEGEEVRYERIADYPGLHGRWLASTLTPVPRGWIVTAIDVHAYKAADQRKDEFLATLAHELRNPLAPIRNAVAILGRKGPQDPEVAWSQGVIERQIDQLSRLIDDLLDIERIARGRFVLKKEAVRLEAVIDMALEASRPQVNAAGHHLSVLLPSERVVIDADPGRIAHALTILLKNAARHMRHRGSISLTASVESGAVLVAIEDSGIGMQQDAEPGVGLTLVRGIVALHNGTLEVRRPASGHGTECALRLPLARVAPETSASPAPSEPARPLRVLVADDNRDAADSLQRVLALFGHEVRVAYDGDSALRVGDEFRPRVAILDIGMPGMNGYDVARTLRGRHGGAMTFVALTGWGQDADRRRASEAGFDYHLTKPVDPGTLDKLLADVARQD